MRVVIASMIMLLLLTACAKQACLISEKHQPPLSAEQQGKDLHTLTGVVIEKGWSRSYESWNAGGSEYYVLAVDDQDLPPNQLTAVEGVILRPSAAIPFEHFVNFVGQSVICKGEFATGEPFIPAEDSIYPHPVAIENPFTGELDHPIRGSGFKVYMIERIEVK